MNYQRLLLSPNVFLVVILITCFLSCKTTRRYPDAPGPPSPFDVGPDVSQDCFLNGGLSKQEKLKIYPFNVAENVKVISFSGKLDKAPILNDTLILSKTIENITLDAVQIDSLTDILYNYNYSEDLSSVFSGVSGCYYPRHAILFTDKSDKIISYIEMCIECKTTKSPLPRESLGVFCDNKYDLFEAFYKSIGITYFKEK